MRLIEWFSEICNRSIEISYVIATVFLLRFLFGKLKLPKKYSYYLWGIPLIRLICPVSFSSIFSLFNVVWRVPAVRIQSNGYIPFQMQEPLNITGAGSGSTASIMQAVSEAPDHTGYFRILLIAYVWIIGILVFGLYSIFSFVRMGKMVKTAVRREGNVYECDHIGSPFVFGVVFPKIYIPFRMEESELRYIVMHERFHIKRKDHIVKLIFFFTAAVYWFHPLVWLAFCCMVRDMEMSCDERIHVELGEYIKEKYSMSLLAFATNHRMNLAGPLAFGETSTKKRVRNVLNFQKPKTWIAIAGVLLTAAAAVVCLTNRKEDVTQAPNQTEAARKENIMDENRENRVEKLASVKRGEKKVSSESSKSVHAFLTKWAEAFCDRDVDTIVSFSSDIVKESLEENEMLSKDQDGYTFGWSSPWPVGEGGYRILEEDEKRAEILYYAWTSDPHLTVWRESLEFRETGEGYQVSGDSIEELQEISSLDEFFKAYPGGVISNTMMDYEANGLGEFLNQNAEGQKESAYYGGFFTPEWSVRNLLNLSQDEALVSVEYMEDTSSVSIQFLREGAMISVGVIQPYGENGIWIPASYSGSSNLLAENEEEGIFIYGLISEEGNRDKIKMIIGEEENDFDCDWGYVGHWNKVEVYEKTEDGLPKVFAFTMLFENTGTSEIWRMFMVNRNDSGSYDLAEFMPKDYMAQARDMVEFVIDGEGVVKIWGNGKALEKETIPPESGSSVKAVLLDNLVFMNADESGLTMSLAVGYQENGKTVGIASHPLVFKVEYSERSEFVLKDVKSDADRFVKPWPALSEE